MEIGGYRIDPLIDGEGRLRPSEMFPDVAAGQWEPHRHFLDRDGLLRIAIGGFLVRGHGRTVLVDLGYGPGSLGEIPTGALPARLRALAVDPAEVTAVVFTHLHADHVGWACPDGTPTFPRATLHCRTEDYDHFVVDGRDPVASERLSGCEDRLEVLDEGRPVLPGVSTLHTPGHTPGSTSLVFSDRRRIAVMLGDVAHCPVQLAEDAWNTGFDVDPGLARRTRRRLLGEFAGDPSVLLGGTHFPGMRFARLLEAGTHRRWVT